MLNRVIFMQINVVCHITGKITGNDCIFAIFGSFGLSTK